MNFLFPTLGSRGDVYPLLTLGQCLYRRGHNVTIIANAVFQPLVEEAGLGFIPLGDEQDYRNQVENPDLWHPLRSFGIVARHGILAMLQPLYKIIRRFEVQDTLVVSSPLLFGSRLAHEKWCYRFCTLHLQPSLLRSAYAPPVLGSAALPGWLPPGMVRLYYRLLDRFYIDPQVASQLNTLRRELGLPAVRRVFDRHLYSPLCNLGLFPDWFAPPQPDWPANTVLTGFIPYQPRAIELSAAVQEFLAVGEPPLVFTPGTAMQHSAAFFRTAVSAARQLKRRAVLLTPQSGQVPANLPDGIIHTSYEPLDGLLPHSAALIYHGGIGTLAQALAAGVPQLIMPMSFDQPDNAARIRRLGVGDMVLPRDFRPGVVAAKLSGLLADESVAQHCRETAGKLDFAQALDQSCAVLEKAGRGNLNHA